MITDGVREVSRYVEHRSKIPEMVRILVAEYNVLLTAERKRQTEQAELQEIADKALKDFLDASKS